MRSKLFATAVLASACIFSSDGKAQVPAQWKNCPGDSSVAWEAQVKGCAEIAGATWESTKNRALAFMRRGIAYMLGGKLDEAVEDFDQSIALDSSYGLAFFNRGNAYWGKGDYAHATQDFTAAIKLIPNNAAIYRGRALALLFADKRADALADVGQAAKLDPKDAYNAIWADIIRQRDKAPSQLAGTVLQLDMNAWPSPVVRMFLGQATPAAVLAAASRASGAQKQGQICEANLYAGEWSLRTGAKEEAMRLFKQASADCPRDYLEWGAANAELKKAASGL